MRAGKSVVYVSRGKPQPATVHAVVGTGPSWFKVLDLDVAGKRVSAVKHRLDGEKTYWIEPHEVDGSAHAASVKTEHAEAVPAPVAPEPTKAGKGRAAAGCGDSLED